ncbi:DUF1836 domain-containing protein [Clostridium sp. SYSU_GA19001]|uniref:DUF1836 domain-containing protein n=1 Tax=Clostridium caldaquaticum TaxID=2940653 RepID=UPI00207701AA|nr:DUF1836 domain-containing protein [Clostridium caldaquaticum]MCM8711685.1 DUF1836 domain-containing protein [Clostridium caldaquaticum]
MNINKENLIQLIEDVCTIDEFKPSEIPCVDLYMDQVTTFFDEKLQSLKRDKNEKILTKTMINNYAKAKLLLPIKGKKYSKEQIMLLSLIYNLKQILSINDLGLILSPIIKSISEDKGKFPLEDLYSSFLDLNKLQLNESNRWFRDKLEVVSEKASEIKTEDRDLITLILSVLMLVASANTQKRMAEKIIDNYFKNS